MNCHLAQRTSLKSRRCIEMIECITTHADESSQPRAQEHSVDDCSLIHGAISTNLVSLM